MALFVVWERNKTIEMGYQVAKLQKNYADLSEKKRRLNHCIDQLKSPETIINKVHSLKLSLIPKEFSPETLVAGQIKLKEQVVRMTKTNLYKNLYTQKDPVPNVRLHGQ